MTDKILAEIYATRERLIASHDDDLRRYHQHLSDVIEAKYADRIVDFDQMQARRREVGPVDPVESFGWQTDPIVAEVRQAREEIAAERASDAVTTKPR